jgi:hypothetical protein
MSSVLSIGAKISPVSNVRCLAPRSAVLRKDAGEVITMLVPKVRLDAVLKVCDFSCWTSC